MEGSFAHSANLYHFKRARWRRLWRQQIQDWIIAAVQNIARLCGAIGSKVSVTKPVRPREGAALARGQHFSAPPFARDALIGRWTPPWYFLSTRSAA
jgi:hypothetical protein